MVSPDWEEIAEDYVAQDIESMTKDYSKYFGSDAKNQMHNDITRILQLKHKKGDLHKYSIVQHYNDLLKGVQKRLIEDRKVIVYNRNGKEIYRAKPIKWNDVELQQLREVKSRKEIRDIAKRLGRSNKSVYDKWIRLLKANRQVPQE